VCLDISLSGERRQSLKRAMPNNRPSLFDAFPPAGEAVKRDEIPGEGETQCIYNTGIFGNG
jgi:hypothetical protein